MPPRGALSWAVVLLAVPALLVPRAASAADPDAAFRRLAAAAGQREPLLRIGLEPGHRVLLSSTTSLRILDPATGAPVWRDPLAGEIAVVAAGGPTGEVPTVYRVQVAAFADERAARDELARLRAKYSVEGVVHHDADRGNWRVRLGKASDRLALGPLVERLRAGGVDGLWIAGEPAREPANVRLRLVDESYESLLPATGRLVAVATGSGRVKVDGTAYRGVIELRVTAYGTVRAINWLELEQYLLGVVPVEMGPEVWPRLEALRAQAVAARTYAWRNRGQFLEEGFDQCATPRCQVYGGASAEHPLSDRAVASTGGEILTYEDEPINAYFTSTCGGHTEAVSAVFPGESAPYLSGVPCRAEADALSDHRGTIEAPPAEPVIDETGRDVTAEWALLRAAGVLEGAGGAALSEPLDAARLRAWTRALAALAGRPEPAGEARPVDTLGRAAAALLADLGWQERAEVLLHGDDLPAILRGPESAGLPAEQRRALAYLASLGTLTAHPEGGFRVDRPPTAARLLPALVRIGEAYDALGLRSAAVARVDERQLTLVEGKGERRVRLADAPLLLGRVGEQPVPTARLELWPGDRVRYRVDGGGRAVYVELLPPLRGTADDRSSSYYSWEERRTRRSLEREINRRVAIGRLERLVVRERGVSGRITELEVVGSKGSTRVRGFDVRRLLGLRESLTVVEPQLDARGRLEAVVFAGKGWGHGVGLCQVGSYGMAVRGAGYREILAHYYPGTTLKKAAVAGR